jgi:hypothetical protein
MNDHDDSSPVDSDEQDEAAAQIAVRSMLRRVRLPRAQHVDLLPGVQARIRQRSRGRFYGDGWSRSRASTSTYVVTCMLMLTILLLVFFVLLPGVRF